MAVREFTDAEVRSDANVAVVNEQFASEFGALADALGHQVTLGNERPLKVIGVAKGMDYMSPLVDPDSAQIFVPAHSPGGSFFTGFVVRVNGPADDRVAMIRDAKPGFMTIHLVSLDHFEHV